VSLRCALFGHEWLHLQTHFVEDKKLESAHLCDRCDEKRSVVLSISEFEEVSADV